MKARLVMAAALALVASCGGAADDGWRPHPASIAGPPAGLQPDGEADPTCAYDDLRAPEACPVNQDLSFSAVCAVDCFGNVFPMNHSGWLILPGNRFYAVVFLSGGERPVGPPFSVRAFTAPSDSPETNPQVQPLLRSRGRERVPLDVDMRRDGSVLVKMQRPFGVSQGEQFRIEMQFTPMTGYAFGAFVNGPQS